MALTREAKDSGSQPSSLVAGAGSPRSKKRTSSGEAAAQSTTTIRGLEEKKISSSPDIQSNFGSEEAAPGAGASSPTSRKRKAFPAAAMESSTSKKRKESASDNSGEPKEKKKKMPRRSRKKAADNTSPTPPSTPAEVTPAVGNKISQVHQFIKDHPDLDFAHGASSTKEIISSRNLHGIIEILCWHYELNPLLLHFPFAQIEEAIVKDESIEKKGKIALDLSQITPLEEQIQEKIARHGLEGKNLLKIEIEMFKEKLKASEGSEKCVGFRPESGVLLDVVEGVEDEGLSFGCVGQKTVFGKRFGICYAPMQEV